MSDQNLDYVAIRRKVEKSLERQKRLYRMIFFWMHLIFFLVTTFAIWGIALTNSQLHAVLFEGGSGAALIVILPTITWAVAILCHVASLYTESRVGQKALREKLLMSEIGEEILRKGLSDAGLVEKMKHHTAVLEAEYVQLTDDGELMPLDEDERVARRRYNIHTNNVSDS